MSRFLRVLGGVIAIAGGLLGSALSLYTVHSEFGGIGGVLLALALFPLTFIVSPFYTLLVYGSWTLFLINYGTLITAWFLAWIADEIEQWLEAEEAAKGKASATLVLMVIGGFSFVVVISALAYREVASTSKATPGPAIAAANTPLPRSTPTQRPVMLHACATDAMINIRRGPGTHYETIGGIVSGACMSILGRNPDTSWVYIVTEDDQAGWVAAWLLSIEGDATRVSVRPDPQAVSLAPTAISSRLVPLCFEIANRLGEYVSCKIEHADCFYRSDTDGTPTICVDQSYPAQDFQLVVLGEDWSNYDDSCIVVSGFLETQRGVMQIQGFSRSQVSYCE